MLLGVILILAAAALPLAAEAPVLAHGITAGAPRATPAQRAPTLHSSISITGARAHRSLSDPRLHIRHFTNLSLSLPSYL